MADNSLTHGPSISIDTGSKSCDLLLVVLPEGRGAEVWKEINGDHYELPFAILAVHKQEIIRILEGSRDSEGQEVLERARAAAQLKKMLHVTPSSDLPKGTLETGQFIIDPSSYRVTRAGKQSSLSVLEFRLLYYLAARPNRLFTRDQLHAAIWRGSRSVNPRIVDVYIRRLRLRIETDPDRPVHVKTLRGMGYLFDSTPQRLSRERG